LGDFSSYKTKQNNSNNKPVTQGNYFVPEQSRYRGSTDVLLAPKKYMTTHQAVHILTSASVVSEHAPMKDLYRSVSHGSLKPIAEISVTAKSVLKTKLLPARNFKQTQKVSKWLGSFLILSDKVLSYMTIDFLFALVRCILPFGILFPEYNRKCLL